ncbi:MAG: S-layer homology domain-containing protein, partial [Oscillospiraceae bacterium]|nr:S-layer homology domain-containing protein [Oscillospiraceae bacterium]
ALDGRYYEVVVAAYVSGVVHGDNNGNFLPLGTLTRAEACTLFRNIGRNQTDQPSAPSTPALEPSQTVPEPVRARPRGRAENGCGPRVRTQL